jgi:capsular exopolysaccharide synthesis family protein
VLERVLSRPAVAATKDIKQEFDPLTYLQEQVSVRQVGKSELYQVSYKSSSAKDAAAIANAIVEEYLLMQDRDEEDRAQVVINVLEQERKDRRDTVDQLRRTVVELAKSLTGRDPFGQGAVTDVAALSVTSIYQTLNETEVEIEIRDAELDALSKAPIVAGDEASTTALLEFEISNRPDVRQLEARIADIRSKAAEVKSKPRQKIGDTWEKDPEYQRLQEEFRLVNGELQQLRSKAAKAIMSQRLEERKAEQQQLIAAKQQELNSLRKKRELLTSKFEDYLDELKEGGAQSAELEFARAELEREEKVFELIAARKLALQTETNAPDRVALMQSAKAPMIALEPIPYKLLLLGCAGALLAPFALAVGHESIVRRVSNQEQLTKESWLPVLGEVTRFPARRVATAQQSLPAAEQRQLLIYTESIDSLRTNLMLTEKLGVPGQTKVIAVCSAASGEGKTSIATSLAMSIAEATNLPTLVLDADLRAPDVGKSFGVPTHPGISEVLSGNVEIEKAIHRVGTTQTYVLPAGKHRVNPHHILQGSKIDELLGSLRGKFSTIVIDTPPVLSASEALVYAKAADSVIFCSLADVSRSKQVRVAIDRLQSTGANIAGTVLSGVPFNRYVYRYGTYNHQVG